jgi:pilus assembly protein CpaB
MKRTVIGITAAVLLATIGTVLLVGYVRSAEDRALAGQQTVEVLVLNRDVARGTSADELESAVDVERIPAKVMANGSVTTLDELGGKVAAVDLVAGEQLVVRRFTEPAALRDTRPVVLPDGMQEITISLAPPRALGGKIAPGDTVGLFASFDLRDERDDGEIADETNEELRQRLSETTKAMLHRLLVTNVQVEQLPRTNENADGITAPELAPTGNLLVTFAVDVPQAERIVFAAEYGAIWLTAQNEATDPSGSRIRTARNIFDD